MVKFRIRTNGDGLKVRRAGPEGGATVYYYDGIRPIWEADGAGALKAQLDRDIFGNLLSRGEVSGVRRYFAHDGLGGLTATTDEAGTHLASLFYDAWGNLRATGGTWTAGNYRFTGAELDPATGLYHMGARFYDPAIGRWLSEDPVNTGIFDTRTLNLYTYVYNNPTLLTDPSGKTVQETVVQWVKDLGVTGALNKLREAWAALGRLADALRDVGLLDARISLGTVVQALRQADESGSTSGSINLGYYDVNVSVGLVANFTFGWMISFSGRKHFYAGVSIGTAGVSTTASIQSITPGSWNVAFTAAAAGVAFQIGATLGCAANCIFGELGAGTPGFQLMVFYVFR